VHAPPFFYKVHRPVQQMVVVEALPLLPLQEIDVFSNDAKVGAFVAACDLRKDAGILSEIAGRSTKVQVELSFLFLQMQE